jgi:ribosomal protein S18 acetylase RimI-like enzyme
MFGLTMIHFTVFFFLFLCSAHRMEGCSEYDDVPAGGLRLSQLAPLSSDNVTLSCSSETLSPKAGRSDKCPEIVFQRIQPNEPLTSLLTLYIQSFLDAYQKCDPQFDLGLPAGDTTESFLNCLFDQEELPEKRTNAAYYQYRVLDKNTKECVGFCSFKKIDEKEQKEKNILPSSLYIENFCILSDKQRSGYGCATMEALKKCPDLSDIRHWYLSTRKVNTGAISFYKKIGFEETSTPSFSTSALYTTLSRERSSSRESGVPPFIRNP